MVLNQGVDGKRKLFWKEVSKGNGGEVEKCSILEGENVRLTLEEVELRYIWNEYFEDLYNIYT